jgi:ParB family chromosome partitioning protein
MQTGAVMITHLPLAAIDPNALPRDRSTLDPDALAELQASICLNGLRQPIEVWQLSSPRDAPEGGVYEYGLISGFRRLTAHRRLSGLRGNGDFTTIPAFIRQPNSVAHALSLMIEENEARADLSPWEKGRILVECVSQGHFDTIDAALKALHPNGSRAARSRLRALANVVDTLDGVLMEAETHSLRALLRLNAALRPDFTPVILTALGEHDDKSPGAQWAVLANILNEAEASLRDPAPDTNRPVRTRRVLRPRSGLTVRRERTADGWCLHFTGPQAEGMMIEQVMDTIERMYAPA